MKKLFMILALIISTLTISQANALASVRYIAPAGYNPRFDPNYQHAYTDGYNNGYKQGKSHGRRDHREKVIKCVAGGVLITVGVVALVHLVNSESNVYANNQGKVAYRF